MRSATRLKKREKQYRGSARCMVSSSLNYLIFDLTCQPTHPPQYVFLTTGFKDMEALRRHLVDNLIGSCVWGLTFMYIRKMGNPEIRHTAWKNTQVRREGG